MTLSQRLANAVYATLAVNEMVNVKLLAKQIGKSTLS